MCGLYFYFLAVCPIFDFRVGNGGVGLPLFDFFMVLKRTSICPYVLGKGILAVSCHPMVWASYQFMLRCCQQRVWPCSPILPCPLPTPSSTSVPFNASLCNWTQPGASLASVLSTKPLELLDGWRWRRKIAICWPCPILRTRAVVKMIKPLTSLI